MSDKEYLAPHLRKDVPTCHAVVIGVAAFLSAICGATAAILSAQLAHYRMDPAVGGYWMSGLFFITPGLTGMIVAYKRRVMTLTSHLGVIVVATVVGVLASVYALLTIYTEHCTPYPQIGECHKTPLMILCMTCLILASILCLVSLGTSIHAYHLIQGIQVEAAAQKEIDDRVAAKKMKKMEAMGQKAQENIAMDVKSPDAESSNL